MKKLLILTIIGGLFFMCACRRDDNDLSHLYENEMKLLTSLLEEKNNESYVKEDIINNINKVYIDNERLLTMGRVISIVDVNELLLIKNIMKIDSTYIVYFPMENEKFVIICNQYGCVERMFFYNNDAPSSNTIVNINDKITKNEVIQKYGYLHESTPLILDKNETIYDLPFYELVSSDGSIFHFYIDNKQSIFNVTFQKSIGDKINKKIIASLK